MASTASPGSSRMPSAAAPFWSTKLGPDCCKGKKMGKHWWWKMPSPNEKEPRTQINGIKFYEGTNLNPFKNRPKSSSVSPVHVKGTSRLLDMNQSDIASLKSPFTTSAWFCATFKNEKLFEFHPSRSTKELLRAESVSQTHDGSRQLATISGCRSIRRWLPRDCVSMEVARQAAHG